MLRNVSFLNAALGVMTMVFLLACEPRAVNDETVASDPLPSWNDGKARTAILDFVAAATDPENASFIPENDRIVVFDNDGTLWSEQPYYFQLQFAMDRVKELAPQHPEWKDDPLFKAVLEDDLNTVMAAGVEGLVKIVMASHAGMSNEEFTGIVKSWIATARHPGSGKLFTEMVYQPMLEVLEYFRSHGFQTWIVSGGGIDFMRPWTEEVYGIPPQQVIGSSVKLKYDVVDGSPVIQRLPELNFIDDKEYKPVGIEYHIGKRPVAAFGNSDGDLAMLKWTAAGKSNSLMVYIHHTDDEREWAYDRESHIGKLDKGLDEAKAKGWVVVDMKNDWNRIYPE